MFPPALLDRAEALIAAYRARGLLLATAESCTGGLVAALLTEIAGSSAVVERGFVTYSNAAKRDLLGVSDAVLRDHGAVSAPCARAMAEGAVGRSAATVAVSVTGIAGPGGGSADKPVGLVHFARAARGGRTVHIERHFDLPDRSAIRLASVAEALGLFEAVLAEGDPSGDLITRA